MRLFSSISLILFYNLSWGQIIYKKVETEKLLNFFFTRDTIKNTLYNRQDKIKGFQFEGDYSVAKIYPNTPPNVMICAVPTMYETSIHQVLKNIDQVYDSVFYQNQISKLDSTIDFWKNQKLILQKRIRFVRSNLHGKLYRETNMISSPLFSKDGQIAIISFTIVNRRFVIKKREKIFIFKKVNNNWVVIKTINSVKNW